MTHITYDPRAASRSMLACTVEQPRTLETALRAWLNSRSPHLMPSAQRLAIAARLDRSVQS